jgi:beta-mannosidase
VSFGDNDVKLSDNYVNVLPGEPFKITIKSKASLEQLQQALKLISLNNYQ